VVELAQLDGETEEPGGGGDPPGGEAGEEKSDRQVGGQRPQHVAGVLFDRPGERRRVGTRGEPEQDDGEDPDGIFNSTSPHASLLPLADPRLCFRRGPFFF
jgi:hypothetical protein